MDNFYKYDPRLIMRCLRMHYLEEIQQNEIASTLNISKAKVSRVIQYAREAGLVDFVIKDIFPSQILELEQKMEERWRLQEVIIVDTRVKSDRELKQLLAKEAAIYLKRILKKGMKVGVSSGSTLELVSDYVHSDREIDTVFIPMAGGSGQYQPQIQPNSIALRLGRAFRAKSMVLHAPALIEKPENKEIFTSDAGIQRILKEYDQLDAALMGIGSADLDSNIRSVMDYLTQEDLRLMAEKGAVADLCSIFIDKQGSGDAFESNHRLIGISLQQLQRIPIRIAVAGGAAKQEAIQAVMGSGLINVLITDFETAEQINEWRKPWM